MSLITPFNRWQHRWTKWANEVFGGDSVGDPKNRALRVLEEACELAQAEDVDAALAQRVIDRVYSRPPGVPSQEAAGTLETLMIYLSGRKFSIWRAVKMDYDRVIEKGPAFFKAKHAEKYAAGTELHPPIP